MDLLVFYCYGHFINGCAIYLMGRNKTVLSSEEKKGQVGGLAGGSIWVVFSIFLWIVVIILFRNDSAELDLSVHSIKTANNCKIYLPRLFVWSLFEKKKRILH
jgi:hypothetical protein